MRVAVVGGGPAGLVAGIALLRLGLDATVLEREPGFGHVGGGVALQTNGMAVLAAIGVLDGLRPALRPYLAAEIRAGDGRVLARTSYGDAPIALPFGPPAIIQRHVLLDRLRSAALAEGVPVRMGHRVTALRRDGDGAVVMWEGTGARAGGAGEEAFDAVVAADGARSVVREAAGLQGTSHPVGEAYLRVVSQAAVGEGAVEVWSSDGRRAGLTPLAGDETYLYLSVPVGGWDDIRRHRLESWKAGWADLGHDVGRAVAGVRDWDAASYDEIAEVHLERWAAPPVFVAGDAAHAMTPNLGQGLNSAVVDALVLARLLAGTPDDLDGVAARYGALRPEFAHRLQREAGRLGRLARLSGAPAKIRDAVLPLATRIPGSTARTMRLLAGEHPPERPYLRPLPARHAGDPAGTADRA